MKGSFYAFIWLITWDCFLVVNSVNIGTLWRAHSIFVGVDDSGNGEVWGYGSEFTDLVARQGTPPSLTNVKEVISTNLAISVLKKDNKLECWGDSSMGGDGPGATMTDVKALYSTDRAFAAIYGADRKVTVWGDGSMGGDEDAVAALTNIDALFSTSEAFAALKENGDVPASWGNLQEPTSGSIVAYGCTFFPSGGLTNVKTIFSTHMAFAALHNNGAVTDWGCYVTVNGDQSPLMPSGLTDVVTIFSSYRAFAALKTDGTMVSWGFNYGHQPDSSKKATTMATSFSAFAVVTTDNTLYGFGQYNAAATSFPTLTSIAGIACNYEACVAITSSGSLTGWGTNSYGGASAPSGVTGVVAVYTTENAFLAVDADTVIKGVWGGITSIPQEVSNDKLRGVFTSPLAFCVVKSDGSVVSWNSDGVITSPSSLTNVETVWASSYYRGLSDSPHSYTLINDRNTYAPSPEPTVFPSGVPSSQPSSQPTTQPTSQPTGKPTSQPSTQPTTQPTGQPSSRPSSQPSSKPSAQPSSQPSSGPSSQPSSRPSSQPSAQPSGQPSQQPSRFNNHNELGCLRGYHSSHVTGHTCIKCEKGKYAPNRGQDECDECPVGFTTIGEASNNITDCYRICEPGYYDNPGFPLHNCDICPAGRYNALSGSHECLPCAAGRYALFGKTVCTACSPGKYSSTAGESACTQCSADFNTSSSGSTACSRCPRFSGTDGATGASTCTNEGLYGVCSAGSDQEGSGKVCEFCPPGKFAPVRDSKCRPCAAGSYSDVWGATACIACRAGAFISEAGASSSKSCINCPKGRYNSFTGVSECKLCEPGSFCNVTNLVTAFECQPGSFSCVKGGTSCALCPPGRYQSEKGTAVCSLCPAGTYNSESGSVSGVACGACAAGKVSTLPGAPSCIQCGLGQYQPRTNQTSCMECSNVGPDLISNEDMTDCVTNGDLLSSAVMDTLFMDGVAVAMAFIIASLFMIVAIANDFRRERIDDTAKLSRSHTAMKSFLAGFSFGSDVMLILGLLNAAPSLAYALLSLRSVHLLGGIIISLVFFSKSGAVDCLLDDSFYLRKGIHAELCRENSALVAVTVFTCLCDVTMTSFFPFRKNPFYDDSKGFPSMSIMKLCLGLKVLQSLGSAGCQMAFLIAMNDESSGRFQRNSQAEALFYLSIFTSAFFVLFAITTMCLQRSVLAEHERGNRNSLNGNTLAHLYPEKGSEETGVALSSPSSSSWKTETGSEKESADSSGIRYSVNPMLNLTRPQDDFDGRDDIGPRLSERKNAPEPDVPSWLMDGAGPPMSRPTSARMSTSSRASSRKSKNLLL